MLPISAQVCIMGSELFALRQRHDGEPEILDRSYVGDKLVEFQTARGHAACLRRKCRTALHSSVSCFRRCKTVQM